MKKLSIRSQFIASPGHVLIQWDLKQAESWVVAYLVDEKNMKHSLLHGDIHTDTATNALFKASKEEITKLMRYTAKQYNHASSYRMKYIRAAEEINKKSDQPPYLVVTLQESKAFSEAWHGYYNIKGWWDEIDDKARLNRTIVNCLGVPHVFFDQWGEELLRKMTAWEPQSTVAYHMNGLVHPDIGIKGGVVEVYKQFVKEKKIFKIVNQSHDSIIANCPKEASGDVIEPVSNLLTRPLVINGEEFTIPVDVEIGEVWGELEEVK